MDYSSICRTCLDVAPLYPIFPAKGVHNRFSTAIYIATGIKIHYNDNFPQSICSKCIIKLNDALKFRKQCREAAMVLIGRKDNSTLSKKRSKKNVQTVFSSQSRSDSSKEKALNDTIKIDHNYVECETNTVHEDTSDATIKNEITDNESINDSDLNDDLPLKQLLTLETPLKAEDNDNESKIYTDLKNDSPLDQLITLEAPLKTEDKDEEAKNDIDFNVELPLLKFELQENLPNYYENVYGLSDKDISEDEKDETPNTHCELRTIMKINGIFAGNGAKNNCIDIKQTNNSNSEPVNNIGDKVRKKGSGKTGPVNISSPSTTLSELHNVTEPLDPPFTLLTESDTQKTSRVLCKLCNKALSIRSIDLHMTRVHPGADRRKVKCDLCDTYVLPNKLNRHTKLMHRIESRCGYCQSDFASKEQLMEHVGACTAKKKKRRTNNGSSRELSECDVCHKVMQRASLRMHKALKHAGLKPVCEHCGKSFGNKFRLKEHYRAKHGYEKFQCKYCEFRSASAMALKNHERRHRGEKPFVCEQCGARFHARYLLAQHQHCHRTDKPATCDLCPASFKANNSLHMHKLTCHSNSTYTCAICSRHYKCRHYAVKHVRLVHRYHGSTPPLTVLTNGEILQKVVVSTPRRNVDAVRKTT